MHCTSCGRAQQVPVFIINHSAAAKWKTDGAAESIDVYKGKLGWNFLSLLFEAVFIVMMSSTGWNKRAHIRVARQIFTQAIKHKTNYVMKVPHPTLTVTRADVRVARRVRRRTMRDFQRAFPPICWQKTHKKIKIFYASIIMFNIVRWLYLAIVPQAISI